MNNVRLEIPFTSNDCDELREGNEFDWTFQGVDENGKAVQVSVHIYNEEEDGRSEIL